MLYSMTGYGKSSIKLGDKSYIIEIKSLNSKSLDLNFKAVAELRGKEIDIRKLISSQLIRGKVDLFFQEEKSNGMAGGLNFNLIENYYQQLKKFSEEKNIPLGDVVPAILRFQDISKAELAELNDDDIVALYKGVEEALKNIIQFRKDEGAQLEKDLIDRIQAIQQLKSELQPHEESRMEKLREKLKQDVVNHVAEGAIDNNRFEEELIYYLEKMDINEEKVRLDTHCLYFTETLQEEV
ncbi:MAG: DUF1732 domain-containing protein, partial [Chitinophagales bacterium]|nr:DUF1732 domain-containing protein [Chitinophagales bacterium]